jgi:ATP-dependent DNA ligase
VPCCERAGHSSAGSGGRAQSESEPEASATVVHWHLSAGSDGRARSELEASATVFFELGSEGIQRSARHKSGVAVRFPRMLRWRTEKKVEDADTLETLRALLPPS